ncbi:MAG: 3-dehydroquinate synthase [Nitrososphaerota archaeon]|nr:3-dehydroquinate synthase [Nitrososphaerota archaeon]MDG6966947.1 3-dehydroquinate synthase [Nitrososphaerota archaeon]MDG6978751.1 3-dehydroquinate synthase [Nitrososphaerota archaeon]MDG7021290.1 3-dehydroquinate synthase [Nitrososphaerota archaeon]
MAANEKELVLDVTEITDLDRAIREAKAAGISSVLSRGKSARLKGGEGLREYREGEGDFAWVEVKGAADLERAVESALRKDHKFVVVDCTNWKIIPLENLIGEFRRRHRRIYAFMQSESDIKLAFSILEKGVDGVVIPYSSLKASKKLIAEVTSAVGQPQLPLARAKIKRIVDVGDGERVCIDTASQLAAGEGMLIGSKASFFFLVHSETIPTEYIPTRPFRVNAGALHSYIFGADGKTRYLSELQAGDKVQLVDSSGRRRDAVVGRIKMERRPLMMVQAEVDGQEGTAMLQNAETIRLVRPDGTPVSVTEAKAGDEVLVHVAGQGKARHFGGEVDEFIVER